MNPLVFTSPTLSSSFVFIFFAPETEKNKSSASLAPQFSTIQNPVPPLLVFYLSSSPPLVLTGTQMYSRQEKKKKTLKV